MRKEKGPWHWCNISTNNETEASSTDKNQIETIIAELTKQNIIVNKTCHELDLFYKSSTVKQWIDFIITKPSPSKSNSISNDKLTPQKQLNRSLPQSVTKITRNPSNINSPFVEAFSKNQRGINVLQTKEAFSITRTQIVVQQNHFASNFLKLRPNCLLLRVMWVVKYLPCILK